MDLLQLVIVLIVVGVLLWLFNRYVTMIDPNVRKIINIVVIVALVIWILMLFVGPLPSIRVGR